MKRRWRGWGDRYDGYGAIVGLVFFLVVGGILGLLAHEGRAAWLIAFSFGCGVMNISSFLLRRTVGK